MLLSQLLKTSSIMLCWDLTRTFPGATLVYINSSRAADVTLDAHLVQLACSIDTRVWFKWYWFYFSNMANNLKNHQKWKFIILLLTYILYMGFSYWTPLQTIHNFSKKSPKNPKKRQVPWVKFYTKKKFFFAFQNACKRFCEFFFFTKKLKKCSHKKKLLNILDFNINKKYFST